MPIADAILRVCDNLVCNQRIIARLAQLGMRITRNKVTNAMQLAVVTSASHQELRKIFAGTPWASGWGAMLRRLLGGQESTQRIWSGFGVAKVTVFDLPLKQPPAEEPIRIAA